MRERVTFVHDAGDESFDPKQLRVEKSALQVTALKAAREEQLIFDVDEVPQEVLLALRQCQQLHIRWTTDRPYPATAPFNARVSPGLQVFFTPQGDVTKATLLCPLLEKIFGAAASCSSPATSFTAMPRLSDRFAPSAAYNFHARVLSLGDLGMYFLYKVCPSHGKSCLDRASALATAEYLDMDWNSTAKTLTLTSYRHAPTDSQTWDETLRLNASRLEVGVLARDKPVPAEPENLALGGFLTVVGKDKKPDPVLFTFPSRHHDSSASYAVSFVAPTGLHPTMRLSLSSSSPPALRYCQLFAHLTLPSVLFPDKYQLSAELFLESKNLRTVRAVWGETDLEAPDWAVSKWGSSMLVELAPPSTAETAAWHADIPLHLRYLAPAEGGLATADIPWPVVFWACRANAESKLDTNPFDRRQLGYDGIFATHTLFHHLQPNSTEASPLRETLAVPVLDTVRSGHVEGLTAATILAGLVWVLWKLLPLRRASDTKNKDKKRQ